MNIFGNRPGGARVPANQLDENFVEAVQNLAALNAALQTQIQAAKERQNHTGTDAAASIRFSDGETLEAFKPRITALIPAVVSSSAPVITTAPTLNASAETVNTALSLNAAGSVTDGLGGAHTDLWQWYRVNASTGSVNAIANATSTSYVRSASDIGHYLYLEQRAKDNTTNFISAPAQSVFRGPVTGTAPSNSVAPSFSPSGSQTPDTVVTLSSGTWTGASTYGYQFYDNGVPIGSRSATNTLTLTSAMSGHTITGDVIATSSLGVSSTAVAASNTVTVSGTNIVANTVLPVLQLVNGEPAGTVYRGFTYNITQGSWTLNGNPVTPSTRQWDAYKDGLYYSSNPNPTAYIDPTNFGVGTKLKNVELVVINGQQYQSSLTSATEYTAAAAPSTLTVQVNTASATFTTGQAITPYIPVTATGGTLPYNYSINPALVAGLSFNTSTGTISGTPSSAASVVHTVSITDSAGSPATVNGQTTVTTQSSSITPTIVLDANVSFVSQGGRLEFDSEGPFISGISNTIGGGYTGGQTNAVNGSTSRFGKFNDPLGGGFLTIRHALHPSDPIFWGQPVRRMDADLGGPVAENDTWWFAIKAMFPTGVYASVNNMVVFDLHGATDGGWYMSCRSADGGLLFQVIRNSGGSPPTGYTNYQVSSYVSSNQWNTFVVKYRGNTSGTNCLTQLWINGVSRVSTTELNCQANTFPGYFKIANYDGGWGVLAGGQWWHYTKAVAVKDNSQVYTEPQIRALVA
jgi:hypothetical protein